MAAHHSWATLPSIIIVEILSYLALTDRLNTSAVCRRWRGCLFHPSLWRSMKFKVKNGHRRKAKHLADMCGKYVKEVVIEFNSQIFGNVRECLRILDILSSNVNLEKIALRPQSCHIEWPDRQPGETFELYLDAIEGFIRNARRLRHLSFGCIGELTDRADQILPLLAEHQRCTLKSLHIASVKENPESYGLIDLPANFITALHNLEVLGMDYDYLTNELLEGFMQPDRARLQKLIIHVHGIEPDHEKITNATWRHLVKVNPKLQVSLNLIHSIDGAVCMLDLLQPAMPLAHLRMFFCQQINVAGINFIAQHHSNSLKSISIVDGMAGYHPNSYTSHSPEDPFVMLAWKCPKLQSFSLIGYDIYLEDIIAIARLRGPQLKTLEIPRCCILEVHEMEEQGVLVSLGNYGSKFINEVSHCLNCDWEPLRDCELHPAVHNPRADAEITYLSILQDDQAW